MARAIWRGTISFGMVSIPVRLFTATESQDITFRQLHAADNSPIRLVKRCSTDGKDLEPDEIVKGYEYGKDRFVLIDELDLEKLPIPSKHTISLSAFVDAHEAVEALSMVLLGRAETRETARAAISAFEALLRGRP